MRDLLGLGRVLARGFGLLGWLGGRHRLAVVGAVLGLAVTVGYFLVGLDSRADAAGFPGGHGDVGAVTLGQPQQCTADPSCGLADGLSSIDVHAGLLGLLAVTISAGLVAVAVAGYGQLHGGRAVRGRARIRQTDRRPAHGGRPGAGVPRGADERARGRVVPPRTRVTR